MGPVPDFLHTALEPGRWPTFVLITARVGGLMLTAPGWSGTTLPRLVRTALTVVISVLLLPLAPPAALSGEVLDLPLPFLSELAIGIVIGLAGAVIMQSLSIAGEVISMQMGLSIAPALAPLPELQVSGIAPLSTLLGVTLYLSLGGHLMLLHGLADSLRVLPPGGTVAFSGGQPLVVALAGQMFACAVSAAAPVMVALLVTNVAIAILGRAVPQLNAMMVSFPLSVGVGLFMFAVSLPIVASVVTNWVLRMPAGVEDLLVHLQP